jgi:hypothetical protein
MMTPKRLARELTARLDGPHAAEHTTAAADLAAESIRYLNYATGSHRAAGLEYPGDAYDVAASLGLAAGRMPQLFRQLAAWLAAEDAAGMLAVDGGKPTADVLAAANRHLHFATVHAERLAASLHALQSEISGLNGRGPNRGERAA